jgi:hypothetical protein
MVHYAGVGRHILHWCITDRTKISSWAKLIFPVELSALLAIATSKLAILTIYLRIFVTPSVRLTTYILIGLVIATWVGESVAGCLQCLPIQYQWDKGAMGGRCFNQLAYYRFLSLPNIATDTVMLVLPMPTVWRLHTTRSQKVGLTFIFLTGSM